MRHNRNERFNSYLSQFGHALTQLVEKHSLRSSQIVNWRWDYPTSSLSWKDEALVECNINVLLDESEGVIHVEILEANAWVDLGSGDRIRERAVILSHEALAESASPIWFAQQVETAFQRAQTLADQIRKHKRAASAKRSSAAISQRTRTRTSQKGRKIGDRSGTAQAQGMKPKLRATEEKREKQR